MRRGVHTRDPYSLKPVLTAYQGFRVQDGELRVPIGRRRFEAIRLTKHTVSVLSDRSLRLRSFTVTSSCLSVWISKEVRVVECTGTVGVDRNLRNLTVGNEHGTVQYGLSKSVRIAETTAEIVGSFKRDDVRVRRVIASKYGQRRRERTLRLLHNVTKQIVTRALREKQAIVLENIEGIRRLYLRGNGQGSRHRRRMNGWSFSEAQHQIIYKAQWIGLPIVRLSRNETRGSSTVCPRCGERLQEDRRLRRKLWCEECRAVMDRDVVAALNLSRRGRLRFDRSRVRTGPEGGAVEAVKWNPTTTVIPGVDAPKSGTAVQQPKT